MSSKRNRHLSIIAIFVIVFFFNIRQTDIDLYSPFLTRFLGLSILTYAFVTGIMAVFVGLLMSVFTFFVGLPFIAPVYALIVGSWTWIFKKVFGHIFGRILKWFPPFQRFLNWVEASKTYKSLRYHWNIFLARVGVKQVHTMKLYEVLPCSHCKKEIPLESRVCMYCGEKREKKKKKKVLI